VIHRRDAPRYTVLDREYSRLYYLCMPRKSLRDDILQAGIAMIHQRGYEASGIRDITGSAGVPQGSFTSYFVSKEAFGDEVLAAYFSNAEQLFRATLDDARLPPMQRLVAYVDAVIDGLRGVGWRYGCMISNLSLETTERSEILRGRLARIFEALTERFAAVVRAGQADGTIRSDVPADDLADVCIAAWHGAMLRMKVDRDPAPLERFKSVVLVTFCPPKDGVAQQRRGRRTKRSR